MAIKRAVIWCAVSSKIQAADDKVSLAYQEEQGRAWADANGYTVIDVLRVPGHSRREADILTLFEDYDALGVSAYRDIRRYWQSRTLDALIAYSPDRLGRAQTLVSYVIENVVNAGAVVHLLQGGTIDASNYRMAIAFSGAQAAGEVDRNVARMAEGRKNNVNQGRMAAGTSPFYFDDVRDKNGRRISLAFNEAYRPLFDAVAEILLSGIPYLDIEAALTARGFRAPDGREFSRGYFSSALWMPIFWGNVQYSEGHRQRFWLQSIEEGHPPIAGYHVKYNTHTPVYVGYQAEMVKAELKRRQRYNGSVNRGGWFKNAVLCDGCGYSVVRTSSNVSGGIAHYLACGTRDTLRTNPTSPRPACPQPQRIREDAARAYITALVDELRNNYTPPDVLSTNIDSAHLDNLLQSARLIDARIAETIRQATDAALSLPAALPHYQDEIHRLTEQSETVKRQIERYKAQATAMRARAAATQHARENLLTGEQIWRLSEIEINRFLHALLGDARFYLKDKTLILR